MAKQRPYVDFAEVKAKVPLPEVLDRLDLLDRLKPEKNSFVGQCPFPDHPHSDLSEEFPNERQFRVDLKNGTWLYHCFDPECNKGGDVINFIKDYFQYSDAHARLWIAKEFGDRLTLTKPKGNSRKKHKPEVEEEEINEKEDAAPIQEGSPKPSETNTTSPLTQSSMVSAAATAGKPLKPLRFIMKLTDSPYLAQRGVTPATSARFGLGHCPPDKKKTKLLADYTAFPVSAQINGKWETVAYFGRLPSETEFTEETPKYKWPESAEHRVLFGLRQALEDSDSPILILVQSPFDLFHCRQHGFPNVVALTKPELSDQQAELLASTRKKVVLFFHGSDVGYTGMRLAAAKLICRAFVRAIKLNQGRQPEHLTEEELQDFLSF